MVKTEREETGFFLDVVDSWMFEQQALTRARAEAWRSGSLVKGPRECRPDLKWVVSERLVNPRLPLRIIPSQLLIMARGYLPLPVRLSQEQPVAVLTYCASCQGWFRGRAAQIRETDELLGGHVVSFHYAVCESEVARSKSLSE